MHKVFVFGTLKQGFPNFKTNKGVRIAGDFQTQKRYPLYLVGERHSPWLVLNEGHGQPVKGQVFEVDDQALEAMDTLERIHEPDGYRRITIKVNCLQSGKELDVFLYAKPPEMLDQSEVKAVLDDEYRLEHAKLYRSRYAYPE
ncbi:gamma-glutamylcyclotransferase family protein [Vibrio hepatarius]|uniref:Gamma-glutamylcyclotransferase family protein n=1 Tax=Vibrio hepatarius TaxID=171383 RepID=A0A0M0I4L8_9VIBR|nr:gamma-glutamylcyclotransferase family protein [Vibrio hepatarius]KOO08868.1 hypothetical protein AKJ31_00420 [Vibrio hepatarius]